MIHDDVSDFVKQADLAMQDAAEVVLRRAREHNTPIIVWRDGKVVKLDPFSLDPIKQTDNENQMEKE
ncbi:MAG: hypothetical protein AAF664_17740 [Planctomycetota bacterium]